MLAKVVYYFYLIMAPLILINIFIAMTNDVYGAIHSDKVGSATSHGQAFGAEYHVCNGQGLPKPNSHT